MPCDRAFVVTPLLKYTHAHRECTKIDHTTNYQLAIA